MNIILGIILALALIILSVGCVLGGGGVIRWIWRDKYKDFVDIVFFTMGGLVVILVGIGLFILFIKLLSGGAS